jgi:hypothetical protein
MQVDESKFERTKAVLDDMIAQKKNKPNPIKESEEIKNIFKELYQKRMTAKYK